MGAGGYVGETREPVGTPCGQARGQAEPVHRLSISGCPRVERSEPSGRAAIIHISTGSINLFGLEGLAAKHLAQRSKRVPSAYQLALDRLRRGGLPQGFD